MTRLEVYQKQQRIFLNIKHKGQENQNALSSLLDGFIGGTNGVLQTHIPRNAVNRIHTDLAAFTKMLDRHLTDENDPIILKHHKDCTHKAYLHIVGRFQRILCLSKEQAHSCTPKPYYKYPLKE